MNPNLAVYLIIGALIWLLLERVGIINGAVAKSASQCRPRTVAAVTVIWSIGLVALWPFFLFYVAIEVMRPMR